MDYKNINHLLEKYWEGETSLQEEATLKQYFNQENVATEHRQFTPLFQYLKDEQDVMISDGFEAKLLAQLEKEQPSAKVRQLSWARGIQTVAAIGIILLGAFFIFQQEKQTDNPYHPERFAGRTNVFIIDDPEESEEAMAATKLMLELISGKMKKGSDKATKGIVEVNKGKNRTFK
ncbi:MAG: hypothetical protein AAF573_19235 [Bacteroidota bacterium]